MKRSVAKIRKLFHEWGDSLYGGEEVTQLEHALQAAWLAEQCEAGVSLIAAALVHDIGHLLHDLDDNAPELGIDDAHEQLAQAFLSKSFGAAVFEPVRLHVAAKRYKCAVDPSYLDRLSAASQQSLTLQGGVMSAAERSEFEASPYAKDALVLRDWDDQAKVVGLKTPSLEHYLTVIERVCIE